MEQELICAYWLLSFHSLQTEFLYCSQNAITTFVQAHFTLNSSVCMLTKNLIANFEILGPTNLFKLRWDGSQTTYTSLIEKKKRTFFPQTINLSIFVLFSRQVLNLFPWP